MLSSADGVVTTGTVTTIRFADVGVELLFRLEPKPNAPAVFAQAGIRNTGPKPVKRVRVHYDGALKVIADQIAGAPFHMIESLTEPPAQLRQAVLDRVNRAGRRGLAFEISEALPGNWRDSTPVVLSALAGSTQLFLGKRKPICD